MADAKGDGFLVRLGDREKVVPASICPACNRAGFHRRGCKMAVPGISRPATREEMAERIQELRP